MGKYGGQPLTAPAIRRRPLLGLDQLRLFVVDGLLAIERVLVVRLERDAPARQDAADDLADAPEPGAHPHRGGNERRGCSARSACRDDADLDQILGMREPRLDARPRRRLPRHNPLVPHRIYLVEVADVGQPDGGH
jgi:hypothetical protein